jgi:hypothetical protein
MLEFLRGKASERKLRLFAVACCRRIWDLLIDERSRKAVEVAERYLDGEKTCLWVPEVREQAHRATAERYLAVAQTLAAANRTVRRMEAAAASAASALWEQGGVGGGPTPAEVVAMRAAYHVAFAVKYSAKIKRTAARPSAKRERGIQCRLLREIFGRFPFLPVTLNPAWLAWSDGTVVKLAQGIYEERAFDRLPILADALEDAGCTDADIPEHCRQPGPHVRGCWVVDLLLGKE